MVATSNQKRTIYTLGFVALGAAAAFAPRLLLVPATPQTQNRVGYTIYKGNGPQANGAALRVKESSSGNLQIEQIAYDAAGKAKVTSTTDDFATLSASGAQMFGSAKAPKLLGQTMVPLLPNMSLDQGLQFFAGDFTATGGKTGAEMVKKILADAQKQNKK